MEDAFEGRAFERERWFRVRPEVAEALQTGAPVVALESSIIAQGMPYPANVETALAVEAAVRQAGAVPATVALLDGQVRVGLAEDDIRRLGTDPAAVKAARRDIARVLVTGAPGGTTVSATAAIARLAGIRVFATGGIGGAHRGVAQHFDISADLLAIAESGVTVVCSGAKAFLDLAVTLELLESLSVAVVGYRTSTFPSFYSRDSGLSLEHRAESAGEIARQMIYQEQLGFTQSLVVANPVPEEAALERAVVEEAIDNALAEAKRQGVAGKAVTPFLLARVKDLTGGMSLAANRKLVVNNARVASEIACAYSRLRRAG
ncbi:MAG: pseudouridine-5'-phosphate glycosidase [Firmicutes bacterium]|nr:pseudouridine-5'-phosphate glycosidase [Bacillota bacterium]